MMLRRLIPLLSALILLSCSGKQVEQLELNGPEDLAGLRVAVTSGSYYDVIMTKRKDLASLSRYSTDIDALQAVVYGKADVYVNDEIAFTNELQEENGITIACREEVYFPISFAFRKDIRELCDSCNVFLARCMDDGTLDSLKTLWFKSKKGTKLIPPDLVFGRGKPIRIAVTPSLLPYSFQVNREWYGIEVDLMRLFAKSQGISLQFDIYDLSGATLALSKGLADIMTGAIFITPERMEQFDFCIPYHHCQPAYFVKAAGSGNANSLWARIKKDIYKSVIMEDRWRFITKGLAATVTITVFAIILGSILGAGLLTMLRSRRRWVRKTAEVYNFIMAGLPMLVFLLIMFYVVLVRTGLSPIAVAILAFALNFASGACGVYGKALGGIPRGQWDAALALGLTRGQAFWNIIVPQALKAGMGAFTSQCTGLLKGTSIVGYIAIQDLTRASDMIRSRTFDALVPLLIVSILYFVLAWLLGLLLKTLVRKRIAK